jgi:spore coat protein H
MNRRALCLTVAAVVAFAGCSNAGTDDPSSAAAPSSADAGMETELDTNATGNPSADTDTGATVDVAADATGESAGSSCDERIDRVTLVRQRSIPGGRQLHLATSGESDQESAAASCLRLVDERLGELTTAVSSAPVGPGATLIVARWGPDDVVTSRAFVERFLAASDPTEMVAVWAWTDDVRQLIGATDDHARIATRIAAVPARSESAVLDAQVVAERAAETWEDVADDALVGLRTVVFVSPTAQLDDLPDIDRDVVIDYWWIGSDLNDRTIAAADENGDDAAGAESVDGADAAIWAADEIVAMLDQRRAEPLAVVGFCDDGGELDLTIYSGDEALRSFGVGDAADEHVGADCDPQDAADHRGDATTTLEVTFTDAQRDEYEAAVAAADAQDGRDRVDEGAAPDPEWTGSITYDGRDQPVGFTADFRGQSTIECDRRSWSLDLDGGDARHLLDASGTDEFVLVSMCADPGYVSQLTGMAVMSQFGVWRLRFDTVELRVDGESQGIYLLIEHPDDEFRNDGSLITSVIRRGYDVADLAPDVKFSREGDAAALESYDELLASVDGVQGDALVDALSSRLDLDQYLRWIAVNVALGSGDYIDEVYFVGEESIDDVHDPQEYFTIHGWDPDAMFTECHRDGRLAIDDPNGLLRCTESLLDRAIFADDTVYARYVDILDEVLDQLTPASFEALTLESASAIQRWLERPGIAPAMTELLELDPDAADASVAAQLVDAAAADDAASYALLRAELIDRIAAFRSTQ